MLKLLFFIIAKEENGSMPKNVLVLGANSDVAKEAIRLYIVQGYVVQAASRKTEELNAYRVANGFTEEQLKIYYFDALAYSTHADFYQSLSEKPNIVLYAAGFLVQNEEAFQNFDKTFRMMQTNYCGAVSILNIIFSDKENRHLERIIGLSSLSGVRGRKSNFVYGSTKSAFTIYLEGLRQELASRNIIVNTFVIGYIDTKINAGLELNQSLIMQPSFVAKKIVNASSGFIQVPGWKWKIIYRILKVLPHGLLAKLP